MDSFDPILEYERPQNHQDHRIGGWLLFFCVTVGLIAPLSLLSTFHRAHFAFDRPFQPICAVIGVIAVVGILRRSSWALSAVALTLAARAAYALVELAVLLFRMPTSPYPIVIASAALIGTPLSLALQFAWFLYFKTSKRVKATFGKNLLAAQPAYSNKDGMIDL